MVAIEECAQVDTRQDHKIICQQDPKIKQKSRKVNQSQTLVEALTSRTGSQTQRLLPQTIQHAARVAHKRVDLEKARDAAVVAVVEVVEEIAAAA